MYAADSSLQLQGLIPNVGQEYALADYRWGVSDPTVVSIELLTVLGAGPLCCWILYQMSQNDPARHYWIVVLSTAEIYGGYDISLVTCVWAFI
jgi:hypothetical protein